MCSRILVCLILTLITVSCGEPQKQDEAKTAFFSGNAMTIDYHITVGKSLPPADYEKVDRMIHKVFEEVDAIYNKFNPDSEISHINRMPAHEKHALSQELEDMLDLVQLIVDLSGRRFDPTIEPLQQLWKGKLSQGTIPTEEEIAQILPAVGWENVHLKKGYLTKDHDLTSLDLGGIAKGLCVDMLAEQIRDAGYPDVFVEWGGEIRAFGQHPDGRDWRIFISRMGDPDPKHAIAELPLKDQAIATSGDYQQNWTVGNTTYSHIIDPRTHLPLIAAPGKITSASVTAPTCALADALATVAMMFDNLDETQAWSEQMQQHFPEAQFWLVQHEK